MKYHREQRKQRKKEQDEKKLMDPQEGDKVWCLEPQWVELLLDGKKRMEVFNCKNNNLSEGQRIYLAKKGTKDIQGYVTYDGHIRLTKLNWAKYRHICIIAVM